MDSEYLVIGTFGVNSTAINLPPIIGLPGASIGTLSEVQIGWLAAANRERDGELITVDYEGETTSSVNVYDGSTASVSMTDLRLAEIDPSSNFSRGQLNVNWCMPVGRTDGLVFAIYESGGGMVGLHGSPFAVFDGMTTTAVLNQAITNQLGLEFNEGGAEDTQEDIEAVTGVYPPRYLAEHIFQRDVPATLRDEIRNAAMFQNPTDGVVVGNMFVVTGSGAQAYTPTSASAVYNNGSNVLSSAKMVSDLDNKKGELSMVVSGERRPAFVVEGRADLNTNTPVCTADMATITAQFDRASPLESLIELWKGATLIESVNNGSLDVDVTCDSNYEIRAYRTIRGQVVDDDTKSFSLDEQSETLCDWGPPPPMEVTPDYVTYEPLMPQVSPTGPLYVTASEVVDPAALQEAGTMLSIMLCHRADLGVTLRGVGALTAVFSRTEGPCNLPYFEDLQGQSVCASPGGLGGVPGRPATASSEKNLLQLPGDEYFRGTPEGENVTVHELAHTIMNVGLTQTDRDAIQARYDEALVEGLWNGAYALENDDEFFAEMSQVYFCANPEIPAFLHPQGINCADELAAYDPDTFLLIDGIYKGGADLR
jgi:hypothetical protein